MSQIPCMRMGLSIGKKHCDLAVPTATLGISGICNIRPCGGLEASSA
jgi:hypothetical protein